MTQSLQKPTITFVPYQATCCFCNQQSHLSMKMWNFVDLALCINLKDRTDRFKQASAEFHKVGLCQKVLFVCYDREPTLRPAAACMRSHQSAAQLALKCRAQRVLIFEDDVLFTNDAIAIGRYLKKCKQFLKNRANIDWDMLYLGHWPLLGYPVFLQIGLFRTFSVMMHAYIMPRHTMRKIIAAEYKGRNLDWIVCWTTRQYVFDNPIAFQRDSPSDNNRSHLGCLQKLFDHLIRHHVRYHRAAEVFAFCTTPLFIAFIVCLILLLLQRIIKRA